jgi:hypothetical protein
MFSLTPVTKLVGSLFVPTAHCMQVGKVGTGTHGLLLQLSALSTRLHRPNESLGSDLAVFFPPLYCHHNHSNLIVV